MSRKVIAVCVTVLLLFTCSYTAFAEAFDKDKTGAISVTLIEQERKEPIVGAELSVYHIATVMQNEDGDLLYDYTEDFRRIDTAIDDATLPKKLDAFVLKNSVPFAQMVTNAEGQAVCAELPLGLYFVKQTNMVDGYSPCKSFLVTVPNNKNGEYLYEVNASPKTEVAKLTSITIKKVWNTDDSIAEADSVTVQLLRDGTVVKTAVLNDQNDWQITYDNLPESDAYSIKEVDVPKGFTATYQQKGYVFTVTNSSTLVQTGQLMWPIPVLAIGGLVFLAIGAVLLQKKGKPNA